MIFHSLHSTSHPDKGFRNLAAYQGNNLDTHTYFEHEGMRTMMKQTVTNLMKARIQEDRCDCNAMFSFHKHILH